jgi:hypothetical protein
MPQHICLPFASEAQYRACLEHPVQYRHYLTQMQHQYPELFPAQWGAGFTWHDRYSSVKQDLDIRRLKLSATGAVYAVRPSFVMPYMIERTAAVEKGLSLRQWGVPFDAIAYVCGRDPMFWYRAWLSLGRPSLVGTLVKDPAKLPRHLVADEKQSWVRGRKVYLPTTVGGGCFLGASLVTAASTEALAAGYGEFAAEARALAPDYQPETVCTDGWKATREAWPQLFAGSTLVLCFLHAILKIKERCQGALRHQVLDRAWHVYAALSKREFAQRTRRLREWASTQLSAALLQTAVLKLCRRVADYLPAYDHPQGARTSNAVDRLLNYQDRVLYAMRYFHHSPASARLAVRALAMQWNFHPYGVRLRRREEGRRSPFLDLNGFQYHANWLENFLIASSLGGRRP